MAPRIRRNRWFTVGLAFGVVVPALTLAALSILNSPRASVSEADRRAFTTYEDAIERAVQDGGFVVTRGMRPGISDIADGAFPDATLIGMAKGWTGSMHRVRRELAAVEPPEFLEEVARRYDEALAAYVKVGEALTAAAEARGDERAALIEEVPALGQRADELWNRARAKLNRERSKLGLAGKRSDAES